MPKAVQRAQNLAQASSPVEPDAHLVPEQPADDPDGMPLPSDLRTVFLGGLFLLALLAVFYAAREIVLPIVLAFILMLVLQPALRMLERLRVPRTLGALLLISLLFGTIVAFATALSGPAASWAAKLPEGVPRLLDHLSFLRPPISRFPSF
jgi:predicted PurR-regulated permease PerM